MEKQFAVNYRVLIILFGDDARKGEMCIFMSHAHDHELLWLECHGQ